MSSIAINASPAAAVGVDSAGDAQQICTFRPSSEPLQPPAIATATEFSDSCLKIPATIILQDGTRYQGYSFGADVPVSGELVFQTGMVGYPESLTDPSYRGQMLVLTYPLIGNYGVPAPPADAAALPEQPYESWQIHATALIVGQYHPGCHSHHTAVRSLREWLVKEGVPAVYGVDTRVLTMKIREHGVTLARIVFGDDCAENVASDDWSDPNKVNLVAQVSTKTAQLYRPAAQMQITAAAGTPLRILAVDVGMKFNQIRCFVNRGVEVKVVPWNYDYLAETEPTFHGLFISNGPGDPTMVVETIERLRKAMDAKRWPIFGICLGHQLFALASGAQTSKMKYGNRGQNIPCTSLVTGRCYITSQNHGFAVDTKTLSADLGELFVNANDGTNEGIYHMSQPFFSVQFHPEAKPGPQDTEFLFDIFIRSTVECDKSGVLVPIREFTDQDTVKQASVFADKRVDVQKVLVLGSGGLSIGQAGEFDYSGSQAIKALKEEGIYTVLINPNIATIQTTVGLADKVYYLPVTPDYVRKVIERERPDGIYVTFGGQTALNIGVKMKDEFAGLGVKVLGTPIETIELTEDRDLFAKAMASIGERCAKSEAVCTVEDACAAALRIGYPVIIRAAYALGGLGSGFADDESQLVELCTKAFAASPQVLVERSMKGWKEVEYEVVRDCNDNCITVCNMENFDPLGIHTGDSIVVAPSQTLTDADYHMLRTTAVNVIRHLGVVGECNIQYALNPLSNDYCIIEVNARLSRSSALASKATGYPLAFVAAKLGLGIPLNSIKNAVTRVTTACFEPSLDYVVVKMPRWDLKKFTRVSKNLSSSMKSVGEVMSIGRTFEETIQKAIRSVDDAFDGFTSVDFDGDLDHELANPSDSRLFAISHALHQGYTVDRIWELTKIDKWFLTKLAGIVAFERSLRTLSLPILSTSILRSAKQLGFSDRQIAAQIESNEILVRQHRVSKGVRPYVKQIDTVAAEFPAKTNYLYMTYHGSSHDVKFDDRGVMVIGSGVYRIGSSVEFDWCAVRAVRTLRANGFKTVMINYNPETVSTDYDESDRLYFENISLERVLDIYEAEGLAGLVLSMGGQSANNIAMPLMRQGARIFGTSPELIDKAENRFKFSRMLDTIGVDQPRWRELTSLDEALSFCKEVGFPVLVRPSYVLSGAAMNVVFSKEDLDSYLSQAVAVSREFPVVISKFIEEAKEIELDAVAHDGKLVMHVISEHVENAGVHSGDATLVLPPQDLDPETVHKITAATAKIAAALKVSGPMNIQFIAKNNQIKVIECNVRASRSFPFVSKVTGVDLIELATKVIMGLPYEAYPTWDTGDFVGVKVPQFSFSRLAGADPVLGVEMASTGEVACFGQTKAEAYLKALLATGFQFPVKKNILLSIGSFKEKVEFLPSVRKLVDLGYSIFATAGTADFIQEHGLPVKYLDLVDGSEESMKAKYSLTQHLSNNLIDLYVNLPSRNHFRRPASYMSRGYRTRRMAVDFSVPLITNIKCAKLFVEALGSWEGIAVSNTDFRTGHRSASLPGLVASFFGTLSAEEVRKNTEAALKSGFTTALALWKDSTEELLWRDHSAVDYAGVPLDGKSIPWTYLPIGAESQHCSLADIEQAISRAHRDSVVITDAKGLALATMLLYASLHDRKIHVTNVTTKEDMLLIEMSKSRGIKLTCDVHVYSLFFTADDFSGKRAQLACSRADCQALWKSMDAIDCISVCSVDPSSPLSDLNVFDLALPLLFSQVATGLISLEDIVAKLGTNPRKIFGVGDQVNTYVDVDLDREVQPHRRRALVVTPPLDGQIHRVVVNGELVATNGGRIEASTRGTKLGPVPSGTRRTVQLLEPIEKQATVQKEKSVLEEEIGKEDARRRSFIELDKDDKVIRSNLSMDIVAKLRDNPFTHKSVVHVGQFNRHDLHILFGVAQEFGTLLKRSGTLSILAGRVLCNLFYEASTRTSSSFEAAMLRLGGTVQTVYADTSSTAKGETLADTVRTLGCYVDAIVLRHPQAGSTQLAAKYAKVPVISAGDGTGEHPTQAFLDVYTIREELGTVNGLTITLVGDLKHGRTVHSLVKLLSMYQVTLNYVSPASLRMPREIVRDIGSDGGVKQHEYETLDGVIGTTDVLYVTRVQRERFEDEAAYTRVKNAYVINNHLLARAKKQMIVMHPLPRVNEIDPEVDFDERAAYFRQVGYGLHVRMALLALVLGSGGGVN